ncbi:hypothetical protein D3C75_267080 [compost metagenome]
MQQIPVITGLIFRHQPAVHQPQLLAVLRKRQLRATHQHQRVVLQLFAADAGEGRIELGQNPLRLRFTAVLQARAGSRVDQTVTVLPEKFSPRLLPGSVHRAFDLIQRRRALQQGQPLLCHLRIGFFAGADQPHQLAVEALHKAVVQRRGDRPEGLFGQHRQHAAVQPCTGQERQQHPQQDQAGQQPQQRRTAAVMVRQSVGVRHRSGWRASVGGGKGRFGCGRPAYRLAQWIPCRLRHPDPAR